MQRPENFLDQLHPCLHHLHHLHPKPKRILIPQTKPFCSAARLHRFVFLFARRLTISDHLATRHGRHSRHSRHSCQGQSAETTRPLFGGVEIPLMVWTNVLRPTTSYDVLRRPTTSYDVLRLACHNLLDIMTNVYKCVNALGAECGLLKLYKLVAKGPLGDFYAKNCQATGCFRKVFGSNRMTQANN